ncbi:MAG: penicillin acylase family protein [Nitriliruptorales bacterium]|nr:penicillin acylase family protein [Nitriliruptorales bacterium]
MLRPLRTAAVTLAVLSVAMAATTGATAQEDPVLDHGENDGFDTPLNILPPGQGTHLNHEEHTRYQADGSQPERNFDQIDLYESLVAASPDLTAEDLPSLFKDASFGIPEDEVTREYSPGGRSGLTVRRDSYGVPHVYGATREDTMFGAGYVSAEDRLFMMDVLRHLGRGRLTELLGASDANLAMDRAQRKLADYTDEELQAMIDRVEKLDPVLGPLAKADLEAYVAGVNARIDEANTNPDARPAVYDALQIPQIEAWQPIDTVAVATLIGGDFSPGGGGQLVNAAVLSGLMNEGYSYDEARTILADLRFANDPEHPHATDTPFPFLTGYDEPDPDAVVVPDDPGAALQAAAAATLPTHIDGPNGPMQLFGGPASNALLVAPELSSTGQPLAVFGPQVGYYSPEILLEIAVHGPGIQARGAAFPGISLYVLLGRGQDYAWSATTAYGDHRDIRAVELCDPEGGEPSMDSTFYLDDGECVEMYTRTDQWFAKPTAIGIPDDPTDDDAILVEMTTERTRHGIVQGRANVDGVPHAFALQRSSYNKEIDATLTFTRLHDPQRIDGIADIQQAFAEFFSYSFNWHFIAPDGVGFQLTGRYPIPPDGVDLDLPMNGNSEWDPVGILPMEQVPHALNPDKGFITNWNNKQAPQWRASDDVWTFGPTHRVQLLTDGVVAARDDDGKVDLAELTQAMGIGATQDLYAYKLLPLLLDVIGDAGEQRVRDVVALLEDWHAGGAHRRDLDGDGEYEEQPPIAVFDEWFPRLSEEIFRPALGDAFDAVPISLTEKARPGGSAYWGAWHGHIHKDLRQVLGRDVDGGFSRTYCGGGDLSSCRQILLDTLNASIDAMAAEFGEDPATWDVDESAEQIQFSALGLASQRPMHWQNRPTFQQVLTYAAADTGGEVAEDEDTLPATGGGATAAVVGLGALLLAARLRHRVRAAA